MSIFNDMSIRTREDLEQFEAAMSLDQRLPEHSILDVFRASAAQYSSATAITMLMTGSEDEQPRCVNYAALLGMFRAPQMPFPQWAAARRASPICCRR